MKFSDFADAEAIVFHTIFRSGSETSNVYVRDWYREIRARALVHLVILLVAAWAHFCMNSSSGVVSSLLACVAIASALSLCACLPLLQLAHFMCYNDVIDSTRHYGFLTHHIAWCDAVLRSLACRASGIFLITELVVAGAFVLSAFLVVSDVRRIAGPWAPAPAHPLAFACELGLAILMRRKLRETMPPCLTRSALCFLSLFAVAYVNFQDVYIACYNMRDPHGIAIIRALSSAFALEIHALVDSSEFVEKGFMEYAREVCHNLKIEEDE